MTVAPGAAAATREIAQVTYYFCSPHCAVTFDTDPDRYASTTARR